MNSTSLPAMWATCIERLKDRVNSRPFWEAIEQTQAVTLDNGTLIIGMDGANFNRASHLQQTTARNAMDRVIEEVFGQRLPFRLIEGTTVADWETVKAREAQVSAMRQSVVTRQVSQEAQAESWETVLEQITRLYSETPLRSLPQSKARFANEALYVVSEAMDRLLPNAGDEGMERNLARVLERIANSADMPASVLAFELERLQAWRKANA